MKGLMMFMATLMVAGTAGATQLECYNTKIADKIEKVLKVDGEMSIAKAIEVLQGDKELDARSITKIKLVDFGESQQNLEVFRGRELQVASETYNLSDRDKKSYYGFLVNPLPTDAESKTKGGFVLEAKNLRKTPSELSDEQTITDKKARYEVSLDVFTPSKHPNDLNKDDSAGKMYCISL